MQGHPRKLRDIRPRSWVNYLGHVLEVERQARRTTFLRAVHGPLKGARLQLKKTKEVEVVREFPEFTPTEQGGQEGVHP